MDRHAVNLPAPDLHGVGTVVRYGHWGRPVVVFPSEQGSAWDYENNGMVDAVADLIEAGRCKLYCVDSFDDRTWSDRSIPLEERARRHRAYEAWITTQVAGFIYDDTAGQASDAIVTGCSMGAYHAMQISLQRADLFPVALCLSGNYDPSSWHAWGERGSEAYFTNPMDYLPNLSGGHLDWLRSRLNLHIVVGQGPWEVHPTGSLPSSERLAGLLSEKDIPHELHVWGWDSAHDWPWWQRQIATYLPRFC